MSAVSARRATATSSGLVRGTFPGWANACPRWTRRPIRRSWSVSPASVVGLTPAYSAARAPSRVCAGAAKSSGLGAGSEISTLRTVAGTSWWGGGLAVRAAPVEFGVGGAAAGARPRPTARPVVPRATGARVAVGVGRMERLYRAQRLLRQFGQLRRGELDAAPGYGRGWGGWNGGLVCDEAVLVGLCGVIFIRRVLGLLCVAAAVNSCSARLALRPRRACVWFVSPR